MTGDDEVSNNRTTIASYEECAKDYALSTAPTAGSETSPALQRLREALPPGGRVLEIGSGPGWDADWLENQGIAVRRTDATKAFVDLQRARGATAELLDVVTDDVGGPYAGVIALYVFQHIDRPQLPPVLTKLSRALIADGVFLFSLREGKRDLVDYGDSGNTYLVAEWEKADLDPILRKLRLAELWSTSSVDAEGRWLIILARKEHSDD